MAKPPTDTIQLPRKLVDGVRTNTPAANRAAGQKLSDRTSQFNKSIRDIRSLAPTEARLYLAKSHGDTSTAVWSVTHLANTATKFLAFNSQHQVDATGNLLLQNLLSRFDFLSDYSLGFDSRMPMSAVKEALLRDAFVDGAAAAELVLDKARLPYAIHPIAVRTLTWGTSTQKEGIANKVVPVQKVGPDQVFLDYPTVFYVPLDQDPDNAYPHSPIEPALNTVSAYSELVEDIRRVVRRSGHSRLSIKLLYDQVVKAAPSEYKHDPQKLQEWADSIRLAVKTELENIDPEAALVFYDLIDANYLNSEIGAGADYTSLVETFDGIQATSLKTPPSVLGKRMGGSQNVSSTESLLFIKSAKAIQAPVAAVLSRALTLAIRLYGFDGYVRVQFEEPDLRPEIELEAFKQMRQQRVLELWSLGLYTDDEAAVHLDTGLRPSTAPPLSGTMFHQSKQMQAPSPNADPARRALSTDAPTSAGGKDNSQGRT